MHYPKVKLTKEISEKQLSWRNNDLINSKTRQNGLLSRADQENWEFKISKDPSIQMFGILNESGENCGTCGLTGISMVHATAEFSLLIGPEYHRQGYGKAALIELLKYGFKNMRLNCVWGETFVHNHALKMFLSLGMKEEGRARQRYFKDGEYLDSIFISILASEARSSEWWK